MVGALVIGLVAAMVMRSRRSCLTANKAAISDDQLLDEGAVQMSSRLPGKYNEDVYLEAPMGIDTRARSVVL